MSTASGKFSRDVIWNVAGLGIAGIAGILLNYVISEAYGPSALGSFNQVFAVYILSSQVAALGIHLSVLQRIAVTVEPLTRRSIATAGLCLTFVLGLVVSAVFYAAGPVVGELLDSGDVAVGMSCAAPGLLFFALNKVLLGCLNGLRRMREYAVLSAGRFLLMLAALAVLIVSDVEASYLPLVLSVSELVLLLCSLFLVRGSVGRTPLSELRHWGRIHLAFGSRGFMSGVLSDLNTRVDVLMLGYFTTDAVVGAYSFAAILAEGFLQILTVLRNNYAPLLTKLIAEMKLEGLQDVVARGRNRTYLVAFPVAAIAVAGYWLIVPLLTSDASLHQSWQYFGILALGIALSSGYIPFNQILLHGNRPGLHTAYILGVVGLNILANILLIPGYGPLGAAAATALAFVGSVLLLRIMSRYVLSIRL